VEKRSHRDHGETPSPLCWRLCKERIFPEARMYMKTQSFSEESGDFRGFRLEVKPLKVRELIKPPLVSPEKKGNFLNEGFIHNAMKRSEIKI
jgi:hypothetical protein